GWTGGGTLKGVSETLIDSVSASVTLANTSLAVTGLPAISLSGFTTANLSDTGSGHNFTISSWTGGGSVSGTDETVTRTLSANVVLSNTSLAVSGLPAIALSGFTAASLSDPFGGHTFTVSSWTGTGSLIDSATAPDTVVAAKSAGFTLSNSALAS